MTKNIYVGLLVLHSRRDRVALVFGYVFCSVVIARTGIVVFLVLFDILVFVRRGCGLKSRSLYLSFVAACMVKLE